MTPNIVVNIFLATQASQLQGFGKLLLLVDEDDASGANSLNGERTVSYADELEVAAAQTAGYISTETKGFLDAVFAQSPKPAGVRVGKVLTGASENETWAAGYAAVRAASDDFYGVAITSRLDADIVGVSAAIETEGDRLFLAQSDDADLLTTGLPSGLSALATRERTAGIWHSSDAAQLAEAWAASRLVFDPDVNSSDWEGQVRGVATPTKPTSTQRTQLLANNFNLVEPYSAAPLFATPGQTMTGRGIYEIVTADWFASRISADFADWKLRTTARGEKITLDAAGQEAALAIIIARLQEGEQKQHFVSGETRATAYTLTADDLTNRRMRFKVEAQIAGSTYLFNFNLYFQQTALDEAA